MSVLLTWLTITHGHSLSQKLVLGALERFSGEKADRLRRMLLKHHESLLSGADAPDAEFGDFENHVLPVYQGKVDAVPWAVREAYDQLVSSLAAQHWRQAAFQTGVLGHYFTDLTNPLHTAYTEKSGLVYLAMRRSVRLAYPRLLETARLRGLLHASSHQGSDWLEQMICQGARQANRHVEALLEHFNVRLARKTPARALDVVCRDAWAEILGCSIAGLAHVLERAAEESGVVPPRGLLPGESIFSGLETPWRLVQRRRKDTLEAEQITRVYREFQKTGRVEQHLPDHLQALRQRLGERIADRSEPGGLSSSLTGTTLAKSPSVLHLAKGVKIRPKRPTGERRSA